MPDREQTQESCGAVSLDKRHVCGKPQGHDGPHVAVLPNHTVAWGGTVTVPWRPK